MTHQSWYEEELQSKNQPDHIKLTLWGIYSTPDEPEPMIRIGVTARTKVTGKPFVSMLAMKPGELIHMKEIYSNNPVSLGYITVNEEPNDEDIFARYKHKILKFKAKLQNTNYEDVFI